MKKIFKSIPFLGTVRQSIANRDRWRANKYHIPTMNHSTLSTDLDLVHQDIEHIAKAKNFHIFTSFRLDVPNDLAGAKARLCVEDQAFPFSLHHDRLLRSAHALGWSDVADWLSGPLGLERLTLAVGSHISRAVLPSSSPNALKVRVTVSSNAVIGVECSLLATGPSGQAHFGIWLPKELVVESVVPSSCKVVVDTEPTSPSLFTAHKTTARTPYENARKRANISKSTADYEEVLLFNPNNEVMEASTSTPHFYRTGRWVTPPLSSGGNAGVTRRVALDNCLCAEEIVRVDSLRDGETVWISNGVRGFIMGSLHLYDRPGGNRRANENHRDTGLYVSLPQK
jgi:4-amino-4-deoxychorismate lyase